jgi:hypothetical protein
MRDKNSIYIDLVTTSKQKADKWFEEKDHYLWSYAKVVEKELE